MLKRSTTAGQQLDRLFRLGTVVGMTDSQLLEQFVSAPDAAAAMAFEVIVERHGPMVLQVCRVVLRDEHAAEDAFQATFLVLARKARTLGSRERLGNWLYGVAHRTARKAKAMAARRRIRDQHVAYHRSLTMNGAAQIATQSEMERVLHEEIDRLPRSYRVAVVACYLEGLTQAAAAQQLRVAESTIRGRLARARKLLGQRLTRRGLVLSTGLLAIGTSATAGAGRVPHLTTQITARAALLYLKRGQAMKGVVSVTALRRQWSAYAHVVHYIKKRRGDRHCRRTGYLGGCSVVAVGERGTIPASVVPGDSSFGARARFISTKY